MILTEEFIAKLISPQSGKPLTLNGEILSTPDGMEKFKTLRDIPILFKENENDKTPYRKHYEADAAAFDYTEEIEDAAERVEINRLRQMIFSEIPSAKGWILDLGCGGGWLAHGLLSGGKKVVSFDISVKNPEKAIQNNPSGSHFAAVGDAMSLPFGENSFDVIVASEIIEHVPDPEKLITEALRVCKPNGKIIITTPYNEKIRYSLCIHCNQLTPNNAHLHSFTENSILKNVPAPNSTEIKIFNSKLLSALKIQKTLGFLPLRFYMPIDKMAIALSGKKAHRLMLIIKKIIER